MAGRAVTASAAPTASASGPGYDSVRRRRSVRSGRERGCWVYIPAEILAEAGVDPEIGRPWYRVWTGRKHNALIRLYNEP